VSTGPTMVAGVDSSTQSCKVVVCDLESGQIEPRIPMEPRSALTPGCVPFKRQLLTLGCWRGSRHWQSADNSTAW
jgi:hypothetical protein